jgi:hypothetical protein
VPHLLYPHKSITASFKTNPLILTSKGSPTNSIPNHKSDTMPGAKYNDAYAKVRAIKSGPTQDQQLDVWFSPLLFFTLIALTLLL